MPRKKKSAAEVGSATAPKTPKTNKKEEEKDPYEKYIGKKTNDGEVVTAVIPKVIKRESQAPVDFVEVRFESMKYVTVKADELDEIFVRAKKK